jgi:hypothetical membrane protein
MNLIDKFYQKVNGCYFAFVGVGTSLLTIFIAYLLYIQVDPTFNILDNFISDLGDGPNYSNVAFSVGVILGSCISLFFYLFLTDFLIGRGAIRYYPY